MAQITYTQIRESIIRQLEEQDADIDLFRDLIDDYIFFCKQERKMHTDIRKNGISYKAISAHGKEYDRENPSLKLAVMYNRQKLAILQQMGLNPESVDNSEEDDSGLA